MVVMDFKFLTLDAMAFLKPHMNHPRTIINAYEHNIQYNDHLERFIHDIRVPTLIIGGTADQFFNESSYRTLANTIPDVQLELFRNETHVVIIEKLGKIKKIIQDFICKDND